MANVLTDLERLALIRSELPLGGQAAIARELGVSSAAVAYVLTGQRTNSPKIKAGIFRWYLNWVATRPAPLPPVDMEAVDRALAACASQSGLQNK